MAKAGSDPAGGGVRKARRYTEAAFSEKRASAALVLAICIRERMPSCIRAPPLAENMIRGRPVLGGVLDGRVIFSPTAALMLPMKKRLSSTPTAHLRPPMVPVAVTTASVRPVLLLGGLHLGPVAGEGERVRRRQLFKQLPEGAGVQNQC